MSTIFISHSSKDNTTATLVQDRLKQAGYASQFLDFDPQNGIPAGRNWERELYRRLNASQAVVILCSEHSMQSQWCFAEVTQARALGKFMFPIKIGCCTLNFVLQQEQVIDFTAGQEEGFERLSRGLKVAGLDPGDSLKWDERRPPYPGLQAFEEVDAGVFFGRSTSIRQTIETLTRLRRLQSGRLLFVLGASGSGKSSLVRAGVLPRLKKSSSEWLTVEAFRPRVQPLDQFALALSRTFDRLGVARDWKTLRDELRGIASKRDFQALLDIASDLRAASKENEPSIVITVDQFEELLARSPDNSANDMSEILRQAVENEASPFLVLATLRSDFLAELQAQTPWNHLPYVDVNLTPLEIENYTEIITKPSQLAAIDLEPGLVDALIADAGASDVLPLLALALRELWERFGSRGRLTVDAYRKELGGMEGLLARLANEALGQDLASEAGQATLRKAFINLVRVNEAGLFVRRAARWDTLPLAARPAIERLTNARLLVTWSDAEGRMVEIVHDTLFRAWEPLASWLKDAREFLLWHRRLQSACYEWEQSHQDSGALLRGGLLAEAERWASERSDGLDAQEKEFVAASVALREKEREEAENREWNIRLEAARASYERSFVLAEQERFQAAAACLLRALELAPRSGAPKGYPSSWARCAWAEEAWTYFRYLDAQRGHMLGRLAGHTGAVTSVTISADGNVALSGGLDGKVRFWSMNNGQALGMLGEADTPVTCVALSADGTRALRGSLDGEVCLLDITAGIVVRLSEEGAEPVTSIAFSSNEKLAVAGFKLGSIGVWDLASGKAVAGYQFHSGSITYLAYDSDRQTIVSGSARPALAEWLGDGAVNVLHIPTQKRTIGLLSVVQPVTSIAASADCRIAVRGFNTGSIEIWSMSTQAEPPGKLLRAFSGHKAAVTSLAISPDARWLLSGSTDSSMRLWDIETGTQKLVMDGHKESVLSLAFGADARCALSASFDGTIGVWELRDMREPRPYKGSSFSTSGISISSDGKRILGSGTAGPARVWNAVTGELLQLLGKYVEPVMSIAVSPDGVTAFSALEKGAILAWDLAERRVRKVLQGHTDFVWDLAVSPDGRTLLSASDDKTIGVWRIETGELTHVLRGHGSGVFGIAFSPDGKRAVSGSSDQTLRVWDLEQAAQPLIVKMSSPVANLAWSPSGRHILTAMQDGTIQLWDVQSAQRVRTYKGHKDAVRSVAFSPDGTLAISGSFDKTVRLWNVASGAARLLQGHEDGVYSVAFSADGKFALSGSMDNTARLWNVGTAEATLVLKGHAKGISSVAFNQDGKSILTGSLDCRVGVWDVTDGALLAALCEGHADAVTSTAFIETGEMAITGSGDSRLRVWDIENGRQAFALTGPREKVSSIAVDGKRTLAGYGDYFKRVEDPLVFGPVEGRTAFDESGKGNVGLWDAHAPSGARLDRHSSSVSSVVFSSDGKRALSGSYDGTVRLWEVEAARQLRLFRGHSNSVWAVALAADGRLAVSGSLDASVRVWDVESGAVVRTLQGHTGGVGALVFSPDGKTIVSGSADKTVRLWNTQTGGTLHVLEGHSGPVTAVAISADGKRVVSGSFDRTARIWSLESGGTQQVLEHKDLVWSVAFNAAGQILFTGADNAKVYIWDVASGKQTGALEGHRAGVNSVAISKEGTALTGSADGTIRYWDIAASQQLLVLQGDGGVVLSVALSPDGLSALSGSEDDAIRVWNLAENSQPRLLHEPLGDVLSVALHSQAQRALAAAADHLVWVWSLNGERLHALSGHTATVTSTALSPDGKVAISGSLDGTLRVWDVDAGITLRVLKGHAKGVKYVAFCPDGKAALSSGADATIRLWDVQSGKQLRVFRTLGPASIAVSPDGRFAVAGGGDDVAIFDLTCQDTHIDPPNVHMDSADPYHEFAPWYRSVGLQVIREGLAMGDIEIS